MALAHMLLFVTISEVNLFIFCKYQSRIIGFCCQNFPYLILFIVKENIWTPKILSRQEHARCDLISADCNTRHFVALDPVGLGIPFSEIRVLFPLCIVSAADRVASLNALAFYLDNASASQLVRLATRGLFGGNPFSNLISILIFQGLIASFDGIGYLYTMVFLMCF